VAALEEAQRTVWVAVWATSISAFPDCLGEVEVEVEVVRVRASGGRGRFFFLFFFCAEHV